MNESTIFSQHGKHVQHSVDSNFLLIPSLFSHIFPMDVEIRKYISSPFYFSLSSIHSESIQVILRVCFIWTFSYWPLNDLASFLSFGKRGIQAPQDWLAVERRLVSFFLSHTHSIPLSLSSSHLLISSRSWLFQEMVSFCLDLIPLPIYYDQERQEVC